VSELDADLRRVQAVWDDLARGDDVFGAIWCYPRLPNQTVEAFLASGEQEIGRALRRGRRRGLPRRRGDALDFGCGAGRLTQAMAARFERAVGVDVAPAMIEAARRLNRHGDRCTYVLNEAPSLASFEDAGFDFVYSNVVLQHMPPALGRVYVAELARVLKPGGLLVFQVPDAREPLARLGRGAVLAELEPLAERLRVPEGAGALVRVRVRNTGSKPWPAIPGPQMIYLGNHWLGADGSMLVRDDARTGLGSDVAPGEARELELLVTAPAEAGEYLLELDLVQQDVAWFSERRRLSRRRTRSVRVPVEVGGAYEPADAVPGAAGGASDAPPGAEMHAIPREIVVAALTSAGARVVEIRRDLAAGLGWRSLRYTATKE
jgi:SAM-dependent methyltransferase